MSCDRRIVEMMPDYHLGQLSPEEAEEVRRHVEEHPACRAELQEISRVLDLVPLALTPVAPPSSLRDRALARALDGAGEPAPAGRSEGRGETAPAAAWTRARAMLVAGLAAAVLAVAVLGWAYLGARNENERLRAGGDLVVVAAEGTGRAPEARGTAVVDPAKGSLALDVYNLPSPPNGHSYRAWLVGGSDGDVPLGEMEVDDRGDGRMTGSVEPPVEGYERVEITVEPVGSEGRSGPVYLEAKL